MQMLLLGKLLLCAGVLSRVELGLPTSKVVVVEIHYDCHGNVLRQENKTHIEPSAMLGVEVPLEDEQHSLETPHTSSNGPRRNQDTGNRCTFTSMPERVRAALHITDRPPRPARSTPTGFIPDKIIGLPIRSCSSGENSDHNGRCRLEFPDSLKHK